MTRMRRLAAGLLVLTIFAAPVAASDQWLHVRVEEGKHGEETVNVNVPLSVIEAMLPMISVDELERGKIDLDQFDLDDIDMEGIDLRELVLAFRDGPDADFVRIRDHGESIRVAKEGDYLIVLVEEDDRHDAETVSIRLPFPVLEAMVLNDSEQIDLLAGLQALREFDGEDLVRVESDDELVRIWIDSSQTGS
jgi:hypothetical protein